MTKKILAILLISFLVLSSVSAWPFSSKNTQESTLVPLSTTLLSTPEKPSTTEEENEPATPSTTSTTTSEIDAEAARILAELEAGLTEMDAGHEVVSDAAKAYEAELAKIKKVAFFGKVNGAWNGALDFSAGVSGGAVFSSKYIVELGVMKKNLLDLSSYGTLSAYGVTFSIGYIF